MLNIGSHLSVSKGYEHMGKEAVSIGANTFQFFSRNPRGGKAKELDEKDINALRKYMKEHNFAKILAHAPYVINSCADRMDLREAAKTVILDDIKRMEYLPDNLYTFHPGCHVGQGVDKGIKLIGDVLNHALYAEQTTIVLLELMSGKGSEVGSNFEEIKEIIDCVELSDKVGVCMDTCHVYSAGYDIVNDLDGVLHKFDDIIGLNKLKAIHLNDSLTPFASHKDRHARIGEGSLGFEAIVRIINHPKLKELPFYLETPNELSGYEEEIKMLREAYK